MIDLIKLVNTELKKAYPGTGLECWIEDYGDKHLRLFLIQNLKKFDKRLVTVEVIFVKSALDGKLKKVRNGVWGQLKDKIERARVSVTV